MIELPPQSRVTSRLDGEVLSITIPRSPARLGCIGGSWSAAAVFGFLAVCCGTQGLLRGHILWTAAGFSFFLIAAWQILALRGGFLHGFGAIKLEIGPESLAKISGPADTPHRQRWPRSVIVGIQVEPKSDTGPASLCLQLLGDPSPVRLFSCDDPEEMEWIAEQIRRRLSGAATA